MAVQTIAAALPRMLGRYGFVAAAIMAALAVAFSEYAFQRGDTQLALLNTYVDSRQEVFHVAWRMSDAESAKRGYLLTGSRNYLERYEADASEVNARLERVRVLFEQAQDEPGEAMRRALAETARAKLGEMAAVLRLNDAGRREDALAMVNSGIGRDMMSTLRTQVDTLIAHHVQRINSSQQLLRGTLMLSRIGVAGLVVLSLAVLGMFLRVSQSLERERRRTTQAIKAERDLLEATVQARTQEISELADHLQTAREDERAALARELHDELGALLTAAKLDVARLKPKLQQNLPEMLPRVASLVESLNAGIALKRRIIEDLRPSTLNNLGLVPALEVLCREFAQRSGLDVQLQLEPQQLGPAADLCVFRLVQEALTNVSKYAQAKTVQVRLVSAGAAAAEISVHDDGQGFDMAESQGLSRHGVRGMRFRVQALHGEFRIDSRPGQGCTVWARVPAGPAAAAAPGLDGAEGTAL